MGRYDFEEELSDSEGDDLLQDEIQALSKACMPASTSGVGGNPSTSFLGTDDCYHSEDDDDDDDEDLELVRNIKEQYGYGVDISQPLSLKPLTSLPPVSSDDEEDDFETLRAIRRRFSQYDGANSGVDDDATDIKSDSFVNNLYESNACGTGTSLGSESLDVHRDDVGKAPFESAENVETASCTSSFPTAAQTFVEAIKKNRSCQKFIRNKLLHIEARMEEIKELQKRLKTLRDFQVQCKKKIGRALSQKQDARVLLISTSKQRSSTKGSEKNVSPMCYGPLENSHVALYTATLENFPLAFQREKWSKNEIKDLEKGIINQFRERLFNKSAEVLSALEPDCASGVDGMISSITNLDITPELIQDFAQKVDWNNLASGCLRRSGAECEARWLNHDNRLINRGNWTSDEDKHLLLLIQINGIHNWSYIAEKLGTNRTPFQCLTRYQRSLNASILKRDWTEDEDAQLRSAVEFFGESNWQAVASVLEGRTGTQCSNRWNKTLLPARQRVGKWSVNEDKHLKVAVTLFGHKSWHRIAKFVPGRTQAQCRERWVNVLDSSLKRGEWTKEEDRRLKAAIAEHGYCWSKVAVCVPLRTDNHCRRRWKQLFPDEVPLLKAAREIKKAALISNFVDRESERPALEANDFVSLPITDSTNNQDIEHKSCIVRKRTGSRKRKASQRSAENYSDCDVALSNGDILQNKKRRTSKSCSKKKKRLGNHCSATEPKGSWYDVESAESHENREMETREKAIELRSRRPRGVRLKKNPPINRCVSSATGIHDSHTNANSQNGVNHSDDLHGQSNNHSHLSVPDDEQKAIELRSRRPRGVRLKKNPPISRRVSSATGIHDSHTNANSQNGANHSDDLHGQSNNHSHLSVPDDEQKLSEIKTMARKKRSSKQQARKGSFAETDIGDNSHGAMQLRTSRDGKDTRSIDVAGPSKQNDVTQLEECNLSTEKSVKWEDLPLSNLFNGAISRLQKKNFR